MFPSGLRGFVVIGVDGQVRRLSGSEAWGGITGTLSDQTDLQAALDLKLEVTSGFWSPLTNGNPSAPELIFDSNGDTIAVWT